MSQFLSRRALCDDVHGRPDTVADRTADHRADTDTQTHVGAGSPSADDCRADEIPNDIAFQITYANTLESTIDDAFKITDENANKNTDSESNANTIDDAFAFTIARAFTRTDKVTNFVSDTKSIDVAERSADCVTVVDTIDIAVKVTVEGSYVGSIAQSFDSALGESELDAITDTFECAQRIADADTHRYAVVFPIKNAFIGTYEHFAERVTDDGTHERTN